MMMVWFGTHVQVQFRCDAMWWWQKMIRHYVMLYVIRNLFTWKREQCVGIVVVFKPGYCHHENEERERKRNGSQNQIWCVHAFAFTHILCPTLRIFFCACTHEKKFELVLLFWRWWWWWVWEKIVEFVSYFLFLYKNKTRHTKIEYGQQTQVKIVRVLPFLYFYGKLKTSQLSLYSLGNLGENGMEKYKNNSLVNIIMSMNLLNTKHKCSFGLVLMMIRFRRKKKSSSHHAHHDHLIHLSIYVKKKIENNAMHFSSSCSYTYLSSSSSVNVHLPFFRQYHNIRFFTMSFYLLDSCFVEMFLLNLAVKN